MAKLNDLIRAASAVTGESEAHLKVLARSLREVGMIATFGRGRHAAEMHAQDGAFLLLGLLSYGEVMRAHVQVEELVRCEFKGAELAREGRTEAIQRFDIAKHFPEALSSNGPLGLITGLVARISGENDLLECRVSPEGGGILGTLAPPTALTLSTTRSKYVREMRLRVSIQGGAVLVLTYDIDLGRAYPDRDRSGARDVVVSVRLGAECAQAIADCLVGKASNDH